MSGAAPVLEVEDLVKHYQVGRRLVGGGATVHAVDGVSLALQEGEMLGLVGESGSGKSTLANCIVRLVEPSAGAIRLHGQDITHLSARKLRPLRRQLHMVFQDPYSSLNPRMTTGQIVGEPLRLHGLARGKAVDGRVAEVFDRVGLRPEVLVADEPVSALDVSVQASILNLLRDLQAELGFSCLFITHDLATVEYLCDRVAVMYLGQIVELADRRDLFREAQHPYTQALLSAALVPDPTVQRTRRRIVLDGDVPSPLAPPSGCRFHTRCPLHERSAPASDVEQPVLREYAPGHLVACHLVEPGRAAPRLADDPADIVSAEAR